MITGFRHKGLEPLFEQNDRSRLQAEHVERIRGILSLLDNAGSANDLNRATLKLHALKGDLQGYGAVTVRANWRIIFRFEEWKAGDVDLIDYH